MFENVRLALSSLRSNKMRALLTMLGIIIGIGSVIAIVTVGQSLTGSITDSMSGLGANNLTVPSPRKAPTAIPIRAAWPCGCSAPAPPRPRT